MWSYSLFAAVLALVALWPTAAAPQDPATPVRPEDLKDNVKVRLVAREHRDDRGQTVVYKLETLGEDRKVVWFEFRPGGASTPHTRTLSAVMNGCLGPDKEVDNKEGLIRIKVKDGVEAIFSLPKDGIHAYGARDEVYERCYLVSLKIGEKGLC